MLPSRVSSLLVYETIVLFEALIKASMIVDKTSITDRLTTPDTDIEKIEVLLL